MKTSNKICRVVAYLVRGTSFAVNYMPKVLQYFKLNHFQVSEIFILFVDKNASVY